MHEFSNPNKVSCFTCEYWHELPKQDSRTGKVVEPEEPSGHGQCRHGKPQMLVVPREVPDDIKLDPSGKILLGDQGRIPTRMIATLAPAIPQTTADFWCGDHPEFEAPEEPPED